MVDTYPNKMVCLYHVWSYFFLFHFQLYVLGCTSMLLYYSLMFGKEVILDKV
jgi:hypothetical protein